MNLPKGGTGKLRHRIYLQAATWTQAESGAETAAWSDEIGPIWASVEPLSGNELVRAQQIVATANVKVVIRHHTGVHSQQRVRFGSRYLGIGAVINFEEKGHYLTLICTEEVP